MADVRFRCPICENELRLATEPLPSSFSCPACGEPIELRQLTNVGNASAPAASPSSAPAPPPRPTRAASEGRSSKADKAGWWDHRRLLSQLKSAIPDERLAAARQVGETNDPQLIKPLLTRLKDPDPHVRDAVIAALERLGYGIDPIEKVALATAALSVDRAVAVGRAGIPALIDVAADDETLQDSRRVAINALGRLQATEAVDQLLIYAKIRDVQGAALEALGRIGDRRAVPVLVEALNDRYTRRWATEGLGRIKDRRSLEPLHRLLQNEDPTASALAAVALGKIRDERSIPLLLGRLQHPQTRRAAAKALWDWRPEEAIEPLNEHLRLAEETITHVRILLAQTADPLLAKKAVETLEKLVRASGDVLPSEDWHTIRQLDRVAALVTVTDREGAELRQEIQTLRCVGLQLLAGDELERRRVDPGMIGLDRLARGDAAQDKQDPVEAVRQYSIGLESDPTLATLWNNRGCAQFRLGRYEEAIDDFTEAIWLDPNFVEAFANRGDARTAQGDLEAAITDLQHVLSLQPSAIDHEKLGDAYLQQAELSLAITEYRLATELGAGASTQVKLGRTCFYRGRLSEALDAFDAAIAQTDQVDWRCDRGLTHCLLGHPRAAIEDFNWVLKHGNDDLTIRNWRGCAKLAAGEFDDAIEEFSQILALIPSANVYYSLGYAHLLAGRPQEALAQFDLAIDHNPDFAEAYVNRGICHRLLGKLTVAQADATLAIALNPKLAEPLINRASLLRDEGDHTAALANLDEAEKLAPYESSIYRHRAAVYVHLGNLEAARIDWTRYVELVLGQLPPTGSGSSKQPICRQSPQ